MILSINLHVHVSCVFTFPITTAVQQIQATFCTNNKIHTYNMKTLERITCSNSFQPVFNNVVQVTGYFTATVFHQFSPPSNKPPPTLLVRPKLKKPGGGGLNRERTVHRK